MDSRRSLWNEQQSHLRKILLKPDKFDEALKLCLEQHCMVHSSEMSGINVQTFEDELWKNLDDKTFRAAIGVKGRTIAYWDMAFITNRGYCNEYFSCRQ